MSSISRKPPAKALEVEPTVPQVPNSKESDPIKLEFEIVISNWPDEYFPVSLLDENLLESILD